MPSEDQLVGVALIVIGRDVEDVLACLAVYVDARAAAREPGGLAAARARRDGHRASVDGAAGAGRAGGAGRARRSTATCGARRAAATRCAGGGATTPATR